MHLNGTVPVKVNGNTTSQTVVSSPALLRIGNSIWKLLGEAKNDPSPANGSGVKKHFNMLIGLEETPGFQIKRHFLKSPTKKENTCLIFNGYISPLKSGDITAHNNKVPK